MISDRISLLHSFVQKRQQEGISAAEDAAHDMAHFYRVGQWTIRLGEGSFPDDLAMAAALLHDLINLPKNHPERSMASEYSAREATKILPSMGFNAQETKLIADAVRDHSYSRGATPETMLGKALQDADRLEALGAIGLMRVFSTGVKLGAKYFHPQDPFAKNRALEDTKYSIDHFYQKLLKLPATMQTRLGKIEAEKRAAVLERFLKDLGHELGEEARPL